MKSGKVQVHRLPQYANIGNERRISAQNIEFACRDKHTMHLPDATNWRGTEEHSGFKLGTEKAGVFKQVTPQMGIKRNTKETSMMVARLKLAMTQGQKQLEQCAHEIQALEQHITYVAGMLHNVKTFLKMREPHLEDAFRRDAVHKMLFASLKV